MKLNQGHARGLSNPGQLNRIGTGFQGHVQGGILAARRSPLRALARSTGGSGALKTPPTNQTVPKRRSSSRRNLESPGPEIVSSREPLPLTGDSELRFQTHRNTSNPWENDWSI